MINSPIPLVMLILTFTTSIYAAPSEQRKLLPPFSCRNEAYVEVESLAKLPEQVNNLINPFYRSDSTNNDSAINSSDNKSTKAKILNRKSVADINEEFNPSDMLDFRIPSARFKSAALSEKHAYVFVSQGGFVLRTRLMQFYKDKSGWHHLDTNEKENKVEAELLKDCKEFELLRNALR